MTAPTLTPDVLRVALQVASQDPTPENLTVALREFPDGLLASEAQRRRSLKRTADQRRGPTGAWSRHNPNVNNCRCASCGRKRKRAEA